MSPGRIPGDVVELRYRRSGPLRGYYRHEFKPGVRMHGNADGSVTLRGPARLHALDTEPDFWHRYGERRKGRGRMARNPGVLSSVWQGARYGYHLHRARRHTRRAERARARLNPRRRRGGSRGSSDLSSLLWIGLGLLILANGTRPGGLLGGGGTLPGIIPGAGIEYGRFWLDRLTNTILDQVRQGLPSNEILSDGSARWRPASQDEVEAYLLATNPAGGGILDYWG